MQYNNDAYKRELTPNSRRGMDQTDPEVYAEQEDQWAVLRHEVEDMQRRHEQVRPVWQQRDTEEDTISARARFSELEQLEQAQHHVDIVVAGVGGGGMNAINRMINTRVRGVRYVTMNTDAQVLALSEAPQRICLGQSYTKGLGAGGNAVVGAKAAAESEEEIRAALGQPDLVFIAAGMGGGTGTGGAPVVASIAKKLGALTVGIVTLPFSFEGTQRRRIAEEGLQNLAAEIDALITIPNDRLLSAIERSVTLSDAFKLADDVLRQGVQGIAEVINVPGMVNVDFADVRSVLRDAGTALMSIGQGQGQNRARRAAEEAIAGGFLNVTIRGAQRVLFNISGDEDMTLFEVNEVAEYIAQAIDTTSDITFGAVIDPALKDTIRVTLIAAGMEERRTSRIPAIQLERLPAKNPAPVVSPARPPATPLPPQAPPVGYREQSPSRPAQQIPPPTAMRRPHPPGRLQRSLDDLRGLRSMGRRQELARGIRPQTDEEDQPEPVNKANTPPFFKKETGGAR